MVALKLTGLSIFDTLRKIVKGRFFVMSEHTANLSKEGRVLIPAAIRQELGLRAGEPLSVSVVDGEVRIVSRMAALRRMQRRLAHLRGPGSSAVDELLRERREAAATE
jgi:AbrB family looped-hinge helix DNA binding protein